MSLMVCFSNKVFNNPQFFSVNKINEHDGFLHLISFLKSAYTFFLTQLQPSLALFKIKRHTCFPMDVESFLSTLN